MRVIGLDLSKSSTGYAVWGPGDARAHIGSRRLGSALTSYGTTFARLHELLADQYAVNRFDAIFYEEPRHLQSHNVQSSANEHFLLVGLAAHAESFGEAVGCRIIRAVNGKTWNRHFLGSMKRGTKRVTLKDYSLQRAREYGYSPRNDDESDALGILDFACDALGLAPPWRLETPLVQQFGR